MSSSNPVTSYKSLSEKCDSFSSLQSPLYPFSSIETDSKTRSFSVTAWIARFLRFHPRAGAAAFGVPAILTRRGFQMRHFSWNAESASSHSALRSLYFDSARLRFLFVFPITIRIPVHVPAEHARSTGLRSRAACRSPICRSHSQTGP